jgi:hypothetical protein
LHDLGFGGMALVAVRHQHRPNFLFEELDARTFGDLAVGRRFGCGQHRACEDCAEHDGSDRR